MKGLEEICRARGTSALLLLAVMASATPAQSQSSGSVTGRVMESGGAPLAGVSVELEGTDRAAETGERGNFLLPNVPAGSYTVVAERIGFTSARATVSVRSGQASEVELVLEPSAIEIEGVTAIGSREELARTRERMREIPGSVTLVEPAELRSTRQTNFKDVMRYVPGVFVQPRFGATDESQFSIRGSGLRNNFHLRGVNLLVNGMPYRLADGFTDFESLELLTTENIQIYKGANALRYGGSTLGGAVNLETKTGHTAEPLKVFGQGGSFGFSKLQASSGQVLGDFNYYASYARTDLDGFRTYSGQRRDRVNLHAGYEISENVDLRSFYMFAYVEEDLPGSLDAEQFARDPEIAHPNNFEQRYGRDFQLHHVGVQLRSRPGGGQSLQISPYFQFRSIEHPIFRVLDQDSRDWGAEARYENTRALGGHENRLTLGALWAWGENDNRHFENEGGEAGALAKNQQDQATSVAVYAEDVFSFTPHFKGVLGLRWAMDEREVDDFFLDDGDQTDSRDFDAFQPKVGMIYEIPSVRGQLFANAARTYEPPLLLELNSFTVPGFIDLDAQDAWQFEIGTRGRNGGFRWDVAAYDIELSDEIININEPPFPDAPFTVPTYRNVPDSRHFGVEVGLEYRTPVGIVARRGVRDRLGGQISYTWGNFRYVDDPEFGDNEIPGVPEHMIQARLTYEHPSGLSLAPNLEWAADDYFVNSENTVRNDGWVTLGIRAEWILEEHGATLFLEGRNLTDEVYSPAVSVDDGAGRFFFPADGRSIYGGVRWHPSF